MKHAKLIRMLAFILVIVMMLEMGPMQVFATGSGATTEYADTIASEETAPAVDAKIPEVYIEGEVTELRSEYEKHYRLTDGSFMAVQYQVPVHYEDEGQWVDIDNTLEAVTMFSGDTVYQTVNGENVQAFASDLSDGTIMTMANGDHMISMSIWTYDSVEEAVVEEVPDNSVVAEDDAEENEPAATQESVPEEPVDSAEVTEASNPDNDLISDLALVEEEGSDMSVLSLDEAENVQEDATFDEQQDDTIVAQILTEEVTEAPVADAEETEPWELDDAMPDMLSSSILYEDVFPGVDLRYDTFSYNVKESIILKQPMDLDEYAYSFLLTLDGLEPELQEDGSILLVDDAYEVQYTIPAPYMWDAENVYSDAVSYELEETDDGWVLTVCADENWLKDEERVYPVTIDPSVNLTTNIRYTTSVQTGTPTSSSNHARLARMSCGYSTTFGQMNGYVQLSELPQLPVGCTITSAKLYPNSAIHWLAADCRMDIYMLTSALAESYWSATIPWNKQPTPEVEAKAMDFIIASQQENVNFAPSSWDITPAFIQWMKNPATNFGLKTVGVPTQANKNAFVRFDKDLSYITVTYRNTVGTEDYYTYETQSAVRAGIGYVGDFSSMLTVLKTDLNFSSETLPFSLAHVYNSSLGGKELDDFKADTFIPDYSKMLIGYGWQLSVQESVRQKTISSKRYLVYRDGDGTLHYCKETATPNVYADEDGLGLEITQTTPGSDKGYMMEDQYGNIRYFRNGYLKYIEDANENRICFLYNGKTYSDTHSTWHPPESGGQLTSIVAVNKGQSAQTICTFTYNSQNVLIKIKDYANRTTTFYYGEDGTGNLEKITHPDGTTVHYQYDSNGNLTRMFDAEAGYGIVYSYDNDGVSEIYEYTAESMNAAETTGTWVKRTKTSIQETVYRYDGNDRLFNTEDDIVNRYAFDYSGRTINTVTMNNGENMILGVAAATYTENSDSTPMMNNRIEKIGQSGQNGVNLLRAGGLEKHDGYTPSNNDWRKNEDNSNYNAAIKNTANENDDGEAKTGYGYLKTWIGDKAVANTTDNHLRVAIFQNVELENGIYTVSAYVNTQGIHLFEGGGAYVAVMNENNAVLSVGNVVNYTTNEQIEDGWQRVYATFECNDPGVYRIAAVQEDALGYAYFDDLQLEVGAVPTTVNLLQNGTFSYEGEWSLGDFSYDDIGDGNTLHPGVIRASGDPDGNVHAIQRVEIGKVCTGQTFLLSGWGRAASAGGCEPRFDWLYGGDIDNDHGKRFFGVIARCWYQAKNGKEHADYHYMPFNDDYDDWQFASTVIVPNSYVQNEEMTLKYIDVYVAYDNNFNTMYVDNLSLRQEPCTTYTHNAADKIIAVNTSGSAYQAVKYIADDDFRPTTVWETESEVYYYQYLDTNNKYLPTYISNDLANTYTYYEYDVFGNTEKTEIGNLTDDDAPSSYPKIKSSAVYSEDGSQLVSATNGNGQTTSYLYNEYRDLIHTTDPNGTIVETHEVLLNDRPQSSYISGVISVNNTYANGLLSRISRGGYIPGNTTKQNQYYNMSYDSFGNMTAVSIGEDTLNARVLASYSYGSNNNHLDSMAYGNGDSITYIYDNLDRITKETWSDGTSFQYLYNSEGALAQKLDATDETKVDNGTADAVNYQYDSLGRLIYSSSEENGQAVILTEHLYDRQNRIDKQTYQLRNSNDTFTTYVSDYSYRAADGALTYVDSVNGNFGDYGFEYDDIARLSARYNYYFRQDYIYRNISSSQTTTQIANIAYSKRDGGTNFNPFSLAYTYDALGNIKTITGTGISGQNASYEYDIQSQLTSAVVDGKNYSYEYDTYGNIRKAVENGTTHTYTYGDADWKDLLTAYDGEDITYDEIGNPTSYYNGTRWDFDWEKGRQLVSAESDDHEIEYTYDMAGIRDSKTVDGVTYNYLTLDGKVVRQTWGNNKLDIIYDNSGLPYALKYNGGYYIYVLNQQGDVIRIVNSTGATVAEYRYDAWGNVIYSSGSMAAVNPIRYRGYYYDTETGFYYLQSRYYDPEIGRFINADDVMFSGVEGSFLSHNLFAYCLNNPVNLSDSGGNLPTWAKKLAVAAAVVVTVAAVAAVTVATCGTGTALACAAMGAAKGAAIGFVTGAVSGAATGAVTHIATTGSTVGIGDAMLNGMADGALTGAISGAVTGALTSPYCFVAGTAVLAAAGAVAIETIQAGDMVWAWDEETSEVALKEVVETYVNETYELVHVFVNGEEIVTTPGHPFYSPVKGWTDAVNLRAGDVLILVNGEYVVVEKIQHEILETPVTVYNFQVEDYHTYYVTNAGVLVHNKCSAGTDDFDDLMNISTGRTEPRNLVEKLAMDAAKSNPTAGKVIIPKLNDPRLAGYSKLSQVFHTSLGKIDIHYVGDLATNVFFDFKFK